MKIMAHPIIIYVPGLLPKPDHESHREALLRCLLAGIRRVDADVADAIASTKGGFDIVSWTYDFYRRHRDISIDRTAIEAVIEQPGPAERDVTEASSWTRRLTRWIYHLGDLLPFLIPHLVSERTEVHLRDLRRYLGDANGIARHTRRMLKLPLLAAVGGQHPVLLIGHSMGSIIAYDTLWELSHNDNHPTAVDLLLTMGSPLGQRLIQKQIKGHEFDGKDRYPTNIGRWQNFAAVGDLTAVDPWLADDFAGMIELGLIDGIEDEEVLNYFRLDGKLNVHSEYGYLVNEKTAHTVANWWRGHDSAFPI